MRNDADDDEREAYEMQHVSKKQRDVRVSYSLTVLAAQKLRTAVRFFSPCIRRASSCEGRLTGREETGNDGQHAFT